MSYAVHLFDLQVWREHLPVMALLGPVLSDRTVTVSTRDIAGEAIVLNCDDERGEAIVAVLRLRVPRDRLRMYHSRTGKGGWRAV